jgi:hypothetical protein
MGSMMYRQRPNLPALIAAGISFVGGILLVGAQVQGSGIGRAEPRQLVLVASITVLLTGIFLLVAFSRYRFTHLWKSTHASHSDKYKHSHKKHGKGRHRHRH